MRIGRAIALTGAAALLLPGLPALATAAAADAPSCHGEPATIVGSPSQDRLRGTAQRDVIVSQGAFEVDALGGDDLVCVTDGVGGGQGTGNVRAGAGDDQVYVDTARADYVWTELGPGADVFRGGTGHDTVWAGDAQEYDDEGPQDAADAERDVISTGRSWDMVITGEPGLESLDEVSTGPGEDEVVVQSTAMAGGMLDLGTGPYDELEFDWPAGVGGTWLFDNTSRTATEDGADRFRWSGVDYFTLPEPGTNAVSFVGSDAGETVSVASFATVDLNGGRDELRIGTDLYSDYPQARPGSLYGGAGRDTFLVDDYLKISVDLAGGRARLPNDSLPDLLLTGIEDVEVYGGRGPVVVRGDAGDNRVTTSGCRIVVRAGGGDDRVVSDAQKCPGQHSGSTLHGGPGSDLLRSGATDDRLAGGPGDDRLLGGPGRDHAAGGTGRDTCRAEVIRSCP
jgi:Ca2+-binding RTX toxin-like protein